MNKNRKFIVIEGTDGCGKQTQTALLKQHFEAQGSVVLSQSFPNYKSASAGPVKMYLAGELCEHANDLDAYQSAALFAVDRLCTMKQLEKHKADIWIFDRYMESNLVHQGGKLPVRQLDAFVDWANNFEYNVLRLPRPTQIIFLNMPPKNSIELARKRETLKVGAKRDIQEEDDAHLVHAWKTGLRLAKKLGWTIVNCTNSKGELLSIEDIHKKVVAAIQN